MRARNTARMRRRETRMSGRKYRRTQESVDFLERGGGVVVVMEFNNKKQRVRKIRDKRTADKEAPRATRGTKRKRQTEKRMPRIERGGAGGWLAGEGREEEKERKRERAVPRS